MNQATYCYCFPYNIQQSSLLVYKLFKIFKFSSIPKLGRSIFQSVWDSHKFWLKTIKISAIIENFIHLGISSTNWIYTCINKQWSLHQNCWKIIILFLLCHNGWQDRPQKIRTCGVSASLQVLHRYWTPLLPVNIKASNCKLLLTYRTLIPVNCCSFNKLTIILFPFNQRFNLIPSSMLNKEIMVIQLLSETHGWLHFFYLPWNTTSIFSLEGMFNLISGNT